MAFKIVTCDSSVSDDNPGSWWKGLVVGAVLFSAILPSSVDAVTVVQLSPCTATVDGYIVNLEPLGRSDGVPRFSLEHGGWEYTFNPCTSYNLPRDDPHAGSGDQCHFVAMCKSRQTESGVSEFYSLGIQRHAMMYLNKIAAATSEEGETSEETSEGETSEGTSEEETSEETSEEENEEMEEKSTEVNEEDVGKEEDDKEENNEEDIEVEEMSGDMKEEENDEENHESEKEEEETKGQNIESQSKNNSGKEAVIEGIVVSELLGRGDKEEESVKRKEEETVSTRRSGRRRKNKRKRKERSVTNDVDSPKQMDDLPDGHGAKESDDFGFVAEETEVNYEKVNISRTNREMERQESVRPGTSSNSEVDYADDNYQNSMLILKYRGIRSQRRQQSYVRLVCDLDRRAVNDALFKVLPTAHPREQYFELHHKCCCPGGCPNGYQDTLVQNTTEPLTAFERRMMDLEENGAGHIWIILVVNVGVLITAITIGLLCFRKGRGNGLYNMLPGLHSSRLTINSLESGPNTYMKRTRPLEYREYSSSILRPTQLPVLDDCIINPHDLDVGQRLGGGLFGDTYVAEWKNHQVAVKRFTVGVHQNQLTEEIFDWLARETAYLSRQRHKSLVTLMGICLGMRQPHLVNEFVAGQSLKDILIKEVPIITPPKKIKMLIQVAEGMTFLHSAKFPVLHRDLRCANFLVDPEDRIKIADFGVTKLMQRLRQECTGREGCYCQKDRSALPASIRWTAPEVLQYPNATEGQDVHIFTPACDVYSFAMCMWELATGLDPFEGVLDGHQVLQTVIEGGRPSDDLPWVVPHYRELMKVCWDQDSANRPTFKQVTMHLRTVLQVASKLEKAQRSHNDSTATSYLKSALSLA